MALWDLVGKAKGEPVWKFAGLLKLLKKENALCVATLWRYAAGNFNRGRK